MAIQSKSARKRQNRKLRAAQAQMLEDYSQEGTLGIKKELMRELGPVLKKTSGAQAPKKTTTSEPRVQYIANVAHGLSRGVSSELAKVKKRVEPMISAGPGRRMALATVLPHCHTARYVAGWSTTPTSVASPYIITTTDFSQIPDSGATNPPELGGGCYFAAVSRDPLNAILEYVPNFGKLALEYAAQFTTYNDLYGPTLTPIVDPVLRLDAQVNETHVLPIAYWKDVHVGNATYVHPHGDKMYTRTSPGESAFRYTYFSKGQTINSNFSNQLGEATTLTGTLGVIRANGDSHTDLPGVTVTSTFVNYTIPESGYYSFALIWTAATATTAPTMVAVTLRMIDAPGVAAVGSYIGHRPLPGIDTRNLLSGVRINGASIMITPDSVELAKGGRITGAQLDSSFTVESVVKNAAGSDPNALLDNITESKGMDFSKGGYAFHKPRTEQSFMKAIPFKHNVDYAPRAVGGVDAAAATVSSYHSSLFAPDGYLGYAVSTPIGVTGAGAAYPGGLVHTTFSFSVEYWHYDVWIGKALPPLGASEFNDIMELVATAPQFHENPLHIADLKRWYNGAMPVLKKFGPGVKSLLTLLFPQAAPVLGTLESLGSMLPDEV